MDALCLKLAAEIVAAAGTGTPADMVLRQTLKRQLGLSALHAREIAQLVFGWFRWRRWLDSNLPPEQQFPVVAELAGRFRRAPETFRDDDLVNAIPDWIGAEMEINSTWLRSLQAESRLWLRAKHGRSAALVQRLGECRIPDGFQDAVEYCGSEDLFRTPEFHTGEFELQDIASQAVGLLCAPKPGETWWDACAGEGGKLLHLSDLMENKGLIWATDRAEWRLKKLKLRAGRAKCFNYRAALWDGGARLPTKTRFDGVLVDGPCTGVGTWQRNPHARWTLLPCDVRELAEVQGRLLKHAAAAVKPGGKLIYSACTLTRAETAEVAASFAREHTEFVALDLKLADQTATSGALTLWPQDLGGNGMFIAAWLRN